MAASVARIAAGQYGRITFDQLIAAGVDRDRVKRWVGDGRLRREHKGVFALGHPDGSPRGVYMSAGAPPPPEVTIPGTTGRRRPGVVIHRSALHPLDISTLDGIPITIVPRILLDIARTMAAAELTRACHEAWIHHRTTPRQVEACVSRNPRKPGAAELRQALGADVTLSALEDGFLELLRNHGLPIPRTNIDHQGDKVDCHWPDHTLTVELVSYRFHATRRAFEQDIARRRRSNHLAYTYGDVFEHAARTAAELRARVARAQHDLPS